MTALGVKTLSVQPRETFVCPPWCMVSHDRGALDEWEYGQWTVQHEGAEVRWETSRGTEMTAQLKWTEIVGSSPIVVEGFLDLVGPTIELAGDDGSGYMGTHEIVAQDWLEWQRVLSELWKQGVR